MRASSEAEPPLKVAWRGLRPEVSEPKDRVVQDRAPGGGDRERRRARHRVEGARHPLVVGEIEGDGLRRLVVLELVAQQLVEIDDFVGLPGTRNLDAGLDQLGAA